MFQKHWKIWPLFDVVQSFSSGSIKNASYTVQILRRLNDNWETGQGSLDTSITSKKAKGKRMDVNTTNILPLWAQWSTQCWYRRRPSCFGTL